MRYKVILLDADGTLFDFHKAEEFAFSAVLEHLSMPDRFDELFPIYMDENRKIWQELEQGLITQETLKVERFRRFLKRMDLSSDPTSCAKIFMAKLADSSILFDDAYDVVKELSRRATLVIITNGLKEVQDKRIRHSVIAPFVKATVISDEIGIQKPDPRIIDYALNLINHRTKNDVVIVGDSLTSDMQGGINAGIDTIWYNPKRHTNPRSHQLTHIIFSLEDLFSLI